MSRIRGGIFNVDEAQAIQDGALQWKKLVEQVGNGTMLAEYFDMQTDGRMLRTCAKERQVIGAYLDKSSQLRDLFFAAQAVVKTSTNIRRWPVISGTYGSDSTGRALCVGISDCIPGTTVCGCTSVLSLETETYREIPASFANPVVSTELIVDTPEKIAIAYLKNGLDTDLIERNDFLAAGGRIRDDMKIPLFKYSRMKFDGTGVGAKIRVDNAAVLEALAMFPQTKITRNPGSESCRLVDIDASSTSSRSCLNGKDDPKIKQWENGFPGGISALEANRKKVPAMVTLFATTPSTEWLTKDNSIVRQIFETSSLAFFGGFNYYHSLQPVSSVTQPDIGTMAMDLRSRSMVDISRYPDSKIASMGKSQVDSYCGLTVAGTRRSDMCSPTLGPLLFECTQYSSNSKTLYAQDPRNRQTCIHGHSCTVSLARAWLGSNLDYVHVPVPGFKLKDHPNAYKRWSDFYYMSVYGTYDMRSQMSEPGRLIPNNDFLPVKELWRVHANSSRPTKFFLPIGVFLETYGEYFQTDTLTDPSMNLSEPVQEHGMWPMCPHDASTFQTDLQSYLKSNMIPRSSTLYTSYQQRITPGNRRVSTCAGSVSGIRECDVLGYSSYRVGMMPGFTMDPSTCVNTEAAVKVWDGIFKCVSCSWWQPYYCVGLHDCLYMVSGSRKDKWSSFRSSGRISTMDIDTAVYGDVSLFYTLNQGFNVQDEQVFRSGLSVQAAIRSVIIAVINEILMKDEQSEGKLYAGVPSMPLHDTEKLLWNENNMFPGFNTGGSSQYEDTLPVLDEQGVRCSDVAVSTPGWDTCTFDDNYDAFINSVKYNMQIPEGLIIKNQTRAAYFTNKAHMLAFGIPAWSKKKRDPRETFVQALLNKTDQCTYATKRDSVCSVKATGGYYVLNPWLGGAFNVYEKSTTINGIDGGCDTTLLDDLATSTVPSSMLKTIDDKIDPRCDVSAVCDDRFEKSQPAVCLARGEQGPSYDTVPINSKHNMCTKQPTTRQSSCKHEQGMLYGLSGQPIMDLHSTIPNGIMGGSPGGIFSNPMFMGTTTPGMKYGRVYSLPTEIAGTTYHVCFACACVLT